MSGTGSKARAAHRSTNRDHGGSRLGYASAMEGSSGDSRELDEKGRDLLLCETVARHFPEARTRDEPCEIDLGFGDLTLACKVNAVHHYGALQSASLFFHLRGGRLGATPVFASVSGYGESLRAAIITGACNWTCTFGPVLRAGLAGESLPDVPSFEVSIDGQRFRVLVDGLDRGLSLDGTDVTHRLLAARARFAPDSWLARVVLESDRFPVLATDRPTVLSVFVSDTAADRTVEVKVDGCDWLGMAAAFEHVAPEPPGTGVMMRELAVVVPISAAPPLTRETILRTLRGVADRAASAPDSTVNWHGVRHHRYLLAPPMPVEALADLEARIGQLPADYRDFLATVGEAGAGPGYGLLSPRKDMQMSHARGEFAWDDGESPRGGLAGVLCLAHAGCGVVWLLVISGRHRGEVWVDAASSDGKARRCATSFSSWYRDWLNAAVRDLRPWIQWDSLCCATASVISQLLEAVERRGITGDAQRAEVANQLGPGAVRLMSGDGPYFPAKTTLNPCEGCVDLAARFSPRRDLFQAGREPDVATSAAKQGWFSRLSERFKRN